MHQQQIEIHVISLFWCCVQNDNKSILQINFIIEEKRKKKQGRQKGKVASDPKRKGKKQNSELNFQKFHQASQYARI